MASRFLTLTVLFLYAGILHNAFSCLPFSSFSPAFAGNYDYAPRVGPYRSEAQSSHTSFSQEHSHRHGFEVMREEPRINTVSSLNCGTFAEKCGWANTNDEEMDWTTVQALPDAERYLSTLATENYPDSRAGALTSSARPGWEGGQLISDPLPCLPNGIRVTATAWRTRLGPTHDQPKLQVCSKNVNEVKFPLINCNDFDVKNGEPVTVDVPAANDPSQPAQIVFYGNNFVSSQGGAIFLQDIVVEGALNCNGETSSHPVLVAADPFRQELGGEGLKQSAVYSKSWAPLGPLKVMESLSSLETLVDASPSLMMEPRKSSSSSNAFSTSLFEGNSISESAFAQPILAVSTAPSAPPASEHSSIPTALFESCLELSCNPSDLSCRFWRSAGSSRWEIGTAGRISNPLTGIKIPPETAQKFLVAPFLVPNINSYTLVSESLTVPLMETVYFCFHEYFATQGLSLSVCTDKMKCFYRKSSLLTGNAVDENKKWNVRCAKLPVGTFELRVIAENLGGNNGEIGFLPIRLARDSAGQQMIC